METKRKQAGSGTIFYRLCCFLIIALIISLLPNCISIEAYSAKASPFLDVQSGDWFGEAVLRAKEEGILQGYPDGTFRPDRTVTYGEFLRMAVGGAPAKRQGHWAEGYHEQGVNRGLFTEEDILKGDLDRCISRKYMALVFAGLLEESGAINRTLTGIGAERESTSSVNFADVDSRSAFKPCIEQTAMVGVLAGYPDHTFRSENFLTRAEAATAFVRLSDLLATAVAENKASGASRNNPPQALTDAARSIEDVMDPAYKAYLDSILKSLRVTGTDGNYRYRFDIPEAPGESDVFFKISFFSKAGIEILKDQTYTSRDGSSRTVHNQITGLRSLSDLGTVIFDFGIIPTATEYWHDYMLIWETAKNLSLRTDYWKRNSNKGFSEYSTRALDYIFSWQ